MPFEGEAFLISAISPNLFLLDKVSFLKKPLLKALGLKILIIIGF